MEFRILAEHAEQMFLETHHQGWIQVSKITLAFEAHLRRMARRKSWTWHGDEMTAQGMPSRLAMALHLRSENQFRVQRGDRRFDFEIIVGDQSLDAEFGGRGAQFAREFAAVGAEADDIETQFMRNAIAPRRSHGWHRRR